MKEQKKVIGQSFKKARTAAGISIEKASKDTRIAKIYLTALEEEQFQKIPGDVVLKGFIKVYSEFLGMDPKPLLAELQNRIKKEATETAVQEGPAPGAAVDMMLYLKFAALALAVILTASAIVFSVMQAVKYTATPAAAPVRTAAVPVPVRPGAEKFRISIHLLGRTWIRVSVDQEEVFTGTAGPGKVLSWEASENVRMRIGNAAAVKVTSGADVLLAPGVPGDVIEEEFTR